MKTSEYGKKFIKEHEGLRLNAYQCCAGKWTIGYGHTSNVNAGMRITEEQAEVFLNEDLKKFENAINLLVIAPLTQSQFDALVSFVFNNGIGAFEVSTLRRKLNAKDYKGASEEFKRWVFVKDPKTKKMKPEAGLVKRRNDEKALFIN